MTDCVFALNLAQGLIQDLIQAGTTAARNRNVAVALAIVDSGGHMVGFLRMAGVHTATVEVALAKARSAAAFRRSTRCFAEQLAQGNLSLLAVPGCVPLFGGVPLQHKHRMIGAVGISGADPNIDEAIAQAMCDQLHKSLLFDI